MYIKWPTFCLAKRDIIHLVTHLVKSSGILHLYHILKLTFITLEIWTMLITNSRSVCLIRISDSSIHIFGNFSLHLIRTTYLFTYAIIGSRSTRFCEHKSRIAKLKNCTVIYSFGIVNKLLCCFWFVTRIFGKELPQTGN